MYGFMSSREGKAQQEQRIRASALLRQSEEAVRTVREKGWNDFAVNGTYHSEIVNSNWSLLPDPIVRNGFTETIVISDTYRDDNGNIVALGGVRDPSTKKVNLTLSWSLPKETSITSRLYIVRLDNITKTYTNHLDFDSGQNNGTTIADTVGTEIIGDAQIQLGAGGGGGDWCDPSKSITEVDLPKSGVANAISAIEGAVFAGTGENAAGVSFAKVGLTINEDPPTALINATFDGYKTNSVFGESNFAYLTTDTSHSQVVILDLTQFNDPPTNSKYQEVGTLDIGTGSVRGQSIYVVNNMAYLTSSNSKLFIFDITDRANPILKNSGGLSLDGVGQKILVAGDYAYIATNSTTYQMEIVNISNPTSPNITGYLNLNSTQSGTDIYINTTNENVTRVYLVTTPQSGKNNFYIINVENKASPTISGLSGYDTGGMTPKGVTVVTGNRAIIVGTGGTNQYQVLNIENETAPLVSCGGLQYATGVHGVSSVLQTNGFAYSYIITGDADAELKIILGGSGGQYSASGDYTSENYDTGFDTAFNRFIANVIMGGQTTLKMQVAVAPSINNSCTGINYTFVGPDLNNPSGSYFTPTNNVISGIVPYKTINPNFVNPGQCFAYKLFFTSDDSTQTPIFYDLILNYSP